MKLISLSQFDIEALKEQGAELEITFIQNVGLALDFKRDFDGYDYYKIIIDNKYHCNYSRRYKTECGKGKKYLDKIDF